MAEPRRFAAWLNATLQSRGLSQAAMARAVGVADAQVSRWRRGQVVPTVHYLQRIADTFAVPRAELDRMAGYPVDESSVSPGGQESDDPERQAELEAHQARYAELLERRVPRQLWRAYVEACEALARSLSASFDEALQRAQGETLSEERRGAGEQTAADVPKPPEAEEAPERKRPFGFRPPDT